MLVLAYILHCCLKPARRAVLPVDAICAESLCRLRSNICAKGFPCAKVACRAVALCLAE